MTEHHDTLTAWLKMLWTWAAVGVSVMTPLQAVQAIAAIAATVYSLVQTYLLIKNRKSKR
jgi:hypothetical protein